MIYGGNMPNRLFGNNSIIKPADESRRNALKILGTAALTATFAPLSAINAQDAGTSVKSIDINNIAPGISEKYPYELPPLPYEYSSLNAAIDEQTMRIHHDKHHRGYTNNLDNALKDHPELQNVPLLELLADIGKVPESIRTTVYNNGGGYFNHSVFWPLMSPDGGGEPSGRLAEAIDRDFGSFDKFKEEFSRAAGTVFGSGWAYLVADNYAKLSVRKYANQGTPFDSGHIPILCIDVWEHAYYLRYQNRRSEYIENFWKVVNWDRAGKNYIHP